MVHAFRECRSLWVVARFGCRVGRRMGYSGRGGYGAGGESVDGGVDTDDAVDFGFPRRGTVD